MPGLSGDDEGETVSGGGVARPVGAVRTVLRAVREDLFRAARDPLPRQGMLGWLPHVHVVLFALVVGLANAGEYANAMDPVTVPVGICTVLQAGSVALALFRPVPAMWLSTAALFVTAEAADGRIPVGRVWPWSVSGIALHTLVLLLLSLRVPTRVSIAALVITLGSGMVSAASPAQTHNQVLSRAAIAFATAVVVGASLRTGRVARDRLVEQEVLTAEERARRTLLEERGRIARELHDVVAHHMSVISIQAQVAPHLVAEPSDELRENLAGIRENAVQALTELRRVLGVLRSSGPESEAARHAPQPTLDRLGALVANVRAAGLDVVTETTGTPRPLSPGTGLCAFRIVQEALSNAMRHAPGARVRVLIGYRPAGLAVRVTNSAPARAPGDSPGTGHGLLGMRERAAMLGGELATGPTPDGGFEVTALLPADPAEDTP
ncbi:sensor histidine kinase [Streptomyces sp. NPDC059070]|uniref:sensor histidine kinase n=1 Tax=Streptomyces sp. NPDC059070 TaxID=3346713 RepID=UPI003683D7F6